MSRLRFPFRSTQSTANVNGGAALTPLDKKDAAITSYWDIVESEDYMQKGKSKDIERLWGLENFGNTCYCNSVLQALYHCEPFRQFVEAYGEAPAPSSALGPPPGVANLPVSPTAPSSPLATKRDNPFDAPGLLSPTSPGNNEKSRWKLGRKPTSSHGAAPSLASISQGQPARTPGTPGSPGLNLNLSAQIPVHNHLPLPNPDQAPHSVFETIQTLFTHLNESPPHQPLPSRKDAKKDDQTASLLPSAPAGSPNGAPTTPPAGTPAAGGKKDEPQGPPLLASLPPPSAPRGGGPFSAGTLGRGVVRPEDLLKTVKRENEMFQGMSQQDAHEFLGWVLNKVAEEVAILDRSLRGTDKEAVLNKGGGQTWVQRLFEGCLTNETRCLSCESTSSRDELFLDLSIDIEQHTSVTSCLRAFSASEMLCQKNKFFCDSCCGLQEAEKRMKIKRLPNVLALHLKRFKYQENLGRYTKLFYRVPFPLQLRLPNTTDDSPDPDRLYELFSVVVHIGNGPHHGHYVCIVRSNGRWVMCDDENVEPIEESDIFRYFGDYPSGAGYVLFYQAVDLDLSSIGLKTPPRVPTPPPTAAPAPPRTADLVDVTPVAPVNGTHVSSDQSPKGSLKVSIPSPTPAAAGQVRDSPALTASSHASTPPQPAGASVARTPSIGEKAAFGFTPAAAAPSGLSASKPKEKEKESKWFNRRKSSIGPGSNAADLPPAAATPARIAPVRQGTNQTVSSTVSNSGAPTPALSTPIRETPTPGTGATGLSSSVISSSALSSNSGTQASPLATQGAGGLGRQASMTATRDRTVSTSSQNSAAAGAGTSYTSGGSLGRKLSGTKGLLGRSGSFMKLGLGKKDKDKKGGNAEGIEE